MSDNNTRAVIGNNTAPTVAETLLLIKEQIAKALLAAADANKKGSVAVQRTAYAIMATHAGLVQQGNIVVSLTLAHTDKDARANLTKAIMPSLFHTEKAKKGMDVDDAADIFVSNNAATKMFADALKLAGILANGLVTHDDFDLKSGRFTVPSTLFCAFGQSPIGILAFHDTRVIDNRPIAMTGTNAKGGTVLIKASASVSQLYKANIESKPRAAQPPGENNDGKGDGKTVSVTATPTTLSNAFGADKLLIAASMLLTTNDGDKVDNFADLRASFGDAGWSAFVSLVQLYHKIDEAMTAKKTAAKKVAA